MKEKFFTKPHPVTLTIEEEMYMTLKKVAREDDMSVGPFIRKVLRRYLKSDEVNSTD